MSNVTATYALHSFAFDDDTLPSLLRDRRNTFSDKVAFSQKRAEGWHSTTWGEYAADVARLSRSLLDHGLEKGDYVAIIGDVSQEWVTAYMATVCAGGVGVGIYFTSSAEEVDYYLEDSRSKFIFVAGEKELSVVLRARGTKSLRKIIAFDPDVVASKNIVSLSSFTDSSSDFSSLLDEQARAVRPNDVASIVYTSGTTGNPKGAILTHRSLIEGVATTRYFCPALFSAPQRVVVHLLCLMSWDWARELFFRLSAKSCHISVSQGRISRLPSVT
jgi:long-chain acyl-CoA synthetase